jgi:hypothetical protein
MFLPQPCSEDIQRKASHGDPAKLQESAMGQPQSATGQYAKAVRERKRFTGQKLSGARFVFIYKQVMSHSPRNL